MGYGWLLFPQGKCNIHETFYTCRHFCVAQQPNYVLFSRQMLVNSRWTRTQPTDISLCLRMTERRHSLDVIKGILVTQRDLITVDRCCVERV